MLCLRLIFFIDLLQNAGLPVPVAGMEIEKYGEVLGEIELAWENQKIAILNEDYLDMKSGLEPDGWKCFSVTEALLNYEPVMAALKI